MSGSVHLCAFFVVGSFLTEVVKSSKTKIKK